MYLIEIFDKGGPIMWPLAICSLVAVAIMIERAINLRAGRILDPNVVARITGLVEGGRADRAIDLCRRTPGIYPSIVLSGLEQASKGEAVAKEAVEDAGRHQIKGLTRYLVALGTIAGISPLLGLLGTVTGMIDVFKTISEVGAGNPNELSTGISQALITTATGLLIAIPTLVAYNFFTEKADSIITKLERETLRVLRTLYEPLRPGSEEVQPAAVTGPDKAE